ncbi:hypothetical protein ACHHV8_26480 [Paenibacillus sp. TAB 01]|uniref:hypothetical protein n=1 Tax=Paenibacillus sp. TAB 01 TaxID=3368988 RepID=UPI0037504A97
MKGAEAPVEISFADSAAPLQVRLHYRHVNQSELYRQADMVQAGGTYTAVIPQEYTASPYSIQYFFEIGYEGGAGGWLRDLLRICPASLTMSSIRKINCTDRGTSS